MNLVQFWSIVPQTLGFTSGSGVDIQSPGSLLLRGRIVCRGVDPAVERPLAPFALPGSWLTLGTLAVILPSVRNAGGTEINLTGPRTGSMAAAFLRHPPSISARICRSREGDKGITSLSLPSTGIITPRSRGTDCKSQ